MLTGKQLKILEVFVRYPFAELTRKQVKEELRERSNNSLALAINQFKKEGIVTEKRIGKSGLLLLNLNNDLTFQYIALVNTPKMEKTVKMIITLLREEIEKVTQFYSLVIFGSYASKEQKETSDLDIAVFIESEDKRTMIEAAINSAKLKSVVEIDAHVISKDEFFQMLVNDEENLGKQIAKKHLALVNHQIFYGLVNEGMKHGFRL